MNNGVVVCIIENVCSECAYIGNTLYRFVQFEFLFPW